MGSKENVLFDYVLVVRLANEKGTLKSVVDYRFPPQQQSKDEKDSLADTIVQFCFPEAELWSTKASSQKKQARSETFSFVLTESDGKKKFGYCRRFLVEDGKGNTIPECFCILSFVPSVSMFNELLNIVEKLRKEKSSSAVFSFLKSVLAKQFPGPGQTISIRTFEGETYELTRSDKNYLLDFVTFEPLFANVPVTLLLDLFAGLVTESRVIVMSRSVSTLSAAVSALSALLYPFTWQHVYIPILPQPLMTYCCAPMPFLVGILESNLPELNKLPMEEGILLDIDSGKLLRDLPSTCVASSVLPPSLSHTLKTDLLKIKKSGTRGHDFNVAISQAFLAFMSQVFGNYTGFFSSHTFQKEKFTQSKSTEIQNFLNYFNETQMYEVFIREREEMSRENKLNLCALGKKNIDIEKSWDDVVISLLTCVKCGDEVESCEGADHKGSFYCSSCHSRKLEKKEKRKEKISRLGSSFKNLKHSAVKAVQGGNENQKKSHVKEEDNNNLSSHNNSSNYSSNNTSTNSSASSYSNDHSTIHPHSLPTSPAMDRRGTLNQFKEASKERMSILFHKIKKDKKGKDDDTSGELLARRTTLMADHHQQPPSQQQLATYRGSTPDDFLKPKGLTTIDPSLHVKKTSSLPLNENVSSSEKKALSQSARTLRVTSPTRSISSTSISAPVLVSSTKDIFHRDGNTNNTSTTVGSSSTTATTPSIMITTPSSSSSHHHHHSNSNSSSGTSPMRKHAPPLKPLPPIQPPSPSSQQQSTNTNNGDNRTQRQLNIKRASTVINLGKTSSSSDSNDHHHNNKPLSSFTFNKPSVTRNG